MERHRTLKVARMADGQVSTKVACSEYAIRLKLAAASEAATLPSWRFKSGSLVLSVRIDTRADKT
jgi:hypothetical protein